MCSPPAELLQGADRVPLAELPAYTMQAKDCLEHSRTNHTRTATQPSSHARNKSHRRSTKIKPPFLNPNHIQFATRFAHARGLSRSRQCPHRVPDAPQVPGHPARRTNATIIMLACCQYQLAPNPVYHNYGRVCKCNYSASACQLVALCLGRKVLPAFSWLLPRLLLCTTPTTCACVLWSTNYFWLGASINI